MDDVLRESEAPTPLTQLELNSLALSTADWLKLHEDDSLDLLYKTFMDASLFGDANGIIWTFAMRLYFEIK